MSNSIKELILKYGIPCMALTVVAIHFFFAQTQQLSKWKGGGYGMYTEIHFVYSQIHIPGLSIDSLLENNQNIKNSLRNVMLMPNKNNLQKAGEHILKTTKRDSIHIQLWKPHVNSKHQKYSRVLVDELYLKRTDF